MKCVFFSTAKNVGEFIYSDIIREPDIEFCDYNQELNSRLGRFLFSAKAEKVIPFALKSVLYRNALKYTFLENRECDEETLFIFINSYSMTQESCFFPFIHFLKWQFPNSKFAFYFVDVLSAYPRSYVDFVFNEFDLVVTFDKKDSLQYGIELYSEGIYSYCDISNKAQGTKSDVFFVGNERGRINAILKLFQTIADSGKQACFFVSGIKSKAKVIDYFDDCSVVENRIYYKNSVLYCNNYISYQRVLSFVTQTKCIVELLIEGQTGFTLRAREAITYHKKLITDCKELRNQEYYRAQNIYIIDDYNRISAKEIADFIDYPMICVDHDFSPKKLVAFIRERLYPNIDDHKEKKLS